MATESRTAKSLKNSLVAIGFYFVNLVLQFFSRKIFIIHLGTEVLGLNTTAMNMLQFLNLAELGIGAAITCTLYKPLLDRDERTINEIVSLHGWMYRRIAWVVIAGSVVLMCFFPLIFRKMPLPLWYAYASFGVLLVGALLSYFINYKQILLSADQKEYKIQYSYKTAMLVKIICQIFTINHYENGYVWWLVLEVVFAFVASFALDIVVRNTYPYLRTDLAAGKFLSRKYPDIITKIKQLFFHKIASFALMQTSPIIIYAYASLTLVALYGNYMLIIYGVSLLMTAMFNSMDAGIGNLVAEGNRDRIMAVFEDLFSVRFLLSCTICFGVYVLTPPFITLWIGAEYVLDELTLGLMVVTLYIQLTRTVIDAYINAYGLFSDIWAPVIEALINVGMSVLLGAFFGLHGILTGVLLSLLLVVFCWKPYLLFRRGFKEKLYQYIALYGRHLLELIIVTGIAVFTLSRWTFDPSGNMGTLLFYGVVAISGFFVLLCGVLCLVERGMRNFIHRIINLCK